MAATSVRPLPRVPPPRTASAASNQRIVNLFVIAPTDPRAILPEVCTGSVRMRPPGPRWGVARAAQRRRPPAGVGGAHGLAGRYRGLRTIGAGGAGELSAI